MLILGLQKLTLLDFPGLLSCTVFTGGCNFRCPYCHNASLVLQPDPQSTLPEEDVFSFLSRRAGLLEGVCVTGGEPTLHQDLPDFLKRVRDMGYKTKLDTNGTYPDRLRAVVDAGLVDMVAMDIKNAPARYAETIGLTEFDMTPIYESVDFLRAGAVPYRFRTTVVREFHTMDEIAAIGAWLSGVPVFALQAFEDSGGCITPGLHAVPADELRRMAACLEKTIPLVELKGI